MDASRPDLAPATGGVATIPDTSLSPSQISAMVAASQSAQPLSAAYAGRSPAESHASYFMGRNMLVHVMMNQRNPPRGRSVPIPAAATMSHEDTTTTSRRKRKAVAAVAPKVNLKEPPASLKADTPEVDAGPTVKINNTEDNSCCICMSDPDPMEASAIDGCEHKFCFECIERWSERENSCPLCKVRFFKIERVHKPAKGTGRTTAKSKSSKKVKNRDQRADLNPGGNPLESLLANMGGMNGAFPPSIARLIFSGLGPAGLQVGMDVSTGVATRQQLQQQQQNRHRNVGFFQNVNSRLEDNLLLSDDELNSSDEDGFHSFVQRMRSRQDQGSLFGGFGPNSDMRPDPAMQQRFRANLVSRSSMPPPPPPPILPRNFASNYLQVGSGNTANSALEICGSDSDDDEIEVVQVTQTRDV